MGLPAALASVGDSLFGRFHQLAKLVPLSAAILRGVDLAEGPQHAISDFIPPPGRNPRMAPSAAKAAMELLL